MSGYHPEEESSNGSIPQHDRVVKDKKTLKRKLYDAFQLSDSEEQERKKAISEKQCKTTWQRNKSHEGFMYCMKSSAANDGNKFETGPVEPSTESMPCSDAYYFDAKAKQDASCSAVVIETSEPPTPHTRTEQRSPLNLSNPCSLKSSENPRPTSIDVIRNVPLNLCTVKDDDTKGTSGDLSASFVDSSNTGSTISQVAEVGLNLCMTLTDNLSSNNSDNIDSKPNKEVNIADETCSSYSKSSQRAGDGISKASSDSELVDIVNKSQHMDTKHDNSIRAEPIGTNTETHRETDRVEMPQNSDQLGVTNMEDTVLTSSEQQVVTTHGTSPCFAHSVTTSKLEMSFFQPLSESTKDGFDAKFRTEVDDEGNGQSQSPPTCANMDALRQLTDELTSLNNDSSFISTPLFERRTPHKHSRTQDREDSQLQTSFGFKTPKKKRVKDKEKTPKKTPAKTPKKTKTPSKAAAEDTPGTKTPRKSSNKTPRKTESQSKTPKKTPGKTPKRKTSEKKPESADEFSSPINETKLLTPILKNSPPENASSSKKILFSELGMSQEKSVSFSVNKRRRHSSSKRKRSHGLRFSLKSMFGNVRPNGDKKSTKSMEIQTMNKSADVSMETKLEKSVDKYQDSTSNLGYDTENSLLSDGENRLEIMEDDGDQSWEDEKSSEEDDMRMRNKELDREITQKSAKYKFTRKNVKSFIRGIIQNEQFSQMIRRCLDEENLCDQVQEAIFAPRLTRSKVKDVLENGQFPSDWAMSPLKVIHESKPKETGAWTDFLGSNLADESTAREDNDSDYDPFQDIAHESDDDESVMSSHVSDFGSPLNSSFSQSQPTTPRDAVSKNLFKNLQSPAQSEPDMRTYATRSKQPLHDKNLAELESDLFFHAPDIELDMFEDNFDFDDDYAGFLQELYLKGNEDPNETHEDEQNDAEFDFIGEADRDDHESEDEEYVYDRRTKIPRTEANDLIEELFKEYGGANVLADDEEEEDTHIHIHDAPNHTGSSKKKMKNPESGTFSKLNEDGTIRENVFSPGHMAPLSFDPTHAALLMTDILKIHREADRAQGKAPVSLFMTQLDKLRLQEQMCKYVQLLAQTYVQAANDTSPEAVLSADTSRAYLTELDILGKKSQESGVQETMFHPPNLQAACALCDEPLPVDSFEVKEDLYHMLTKDNISTGSGKKKKGSPLACNLSYAQMRVLLTSEAFVYPDLLPSMSSRAPSAASSKKVRFTKSEDMLLVCAWKNLDEGCVNRKYEIIRESLMPSKSKEQLISRIKNLKRGRVADRRDVMQLLLDENASTVKPDITQLQQPIKLKPAIVRGTCLPAWTSAYLAIVKKHFSGVQPAVAMDADEAEDKNDGDMQSDSSVTEQPTTSKETPPVELVMKISKNEAPEPKKIAKTNVEKQENDDLDTPGKLLPGVRPATPTDTAQLISDNVNKAVGKSGFKNVRLVRVRRQRNPSPQHKSPVHIIPHPVHRPANSALALPEGMTTPIILAKGLKTPVMVMCKDTKENTPPPNATGKGKSPPFYAIGKGKSPTPNATGKEKSKLHPETIANLADLYKGGLVPARNYVQVVAAPVFKVTTSSIPGHRTTSVITISTPSTVRSVSSQSVNRNARLPPPMTVQRSATGSRFSLIPLTSTTAARAPAARPSASKPAASGLSAGPSTSASAVSATSSGCPQSPTEALQKLCATPQTLSKSCISPRSIHKMVFGTPQSDKKTSAKSSGETGAQSVSSRMDTSQTPPMTSQNTPTATRSLIGSAMAEAVGVSPSKLGTPETLNKMGISPAKVPVISQQMAKKVKEQRSGPDAKRNLATVYESIDENPLPPQVRKDTEPMESRTPSEPSISAAKSPVNSPHISPTPFANASLLENLSETPSFRRFSPVPSNIALTTDSSTMLGDKSSASSGFDSDLLVTPKKLDFIDESSTLRTPRAERVLEDKLKRFGESPAAKTFLRALDTPTKRTVVMIEELASMATSSASVGQPSPQRTAVTSSTPVTSSFSSIHVTSHSMVTSPQTASSVSGPQTPAKTRKVVELLEQMAYEAGSSPETSLSSPPYRRGGASGETQSQHVTTPSRTGGVEQIQQSPRDDGEVLSITEASGLASIREICSKNGTPTKTPLRHRAILPKGTLSPPRQSPILDSSRKRDTPKRKPTNQKLRPLAPKGVIMTAHLSPAKQAAAAITARAKEILSPNKNTPRRFRAIAPKSPIVTSPLAPPTSSKRRIFSPPPPGGCERQMLDDEGEDQEEELEQDAVMTRRQHNLRKRQRLSECDEATPTTRVDDVTANDVTDAVKTDSDADDVKQEGEDEFKVEMDIAGQEDVDYDMLMKASTTIRFDPNKQDLDPQRSKSQQKKDAMVEMLASDLIESDPLNDERDTAYAQQYMNKVKDAFANDPDKFTQFLRMLHEFGRSKETPVELYHKMCELFEGHIELMNDFAAFLLPAQARECGCLMLLQEYMKARTFLRKLEVHFKKLPGMLQRVLTAFGKWETLPTKNVADLQAEIRPLLKGQQYLMDEFSTFFGDAAVPDSHMTDFEEFQMPGSSDEEGDTDSCEEVTIPPETDNTYGTRECACACHTRDDAQPGYVKRSKHCLSCGISVIRGRMFLHDEDKLRPLQVKTHTPRKPEDAAEEGEVEEGEAEEAEIDLILSDLEDEEDEVKVEVEEDAGEEAAEDGVQLEAEDQHDILDDDDDDEEVEEEIASIASEEVASIASEEVASIASEEDEDEAEGGATATESVAGDDDDVDDVTNDDNHDMLDDDSDEAKSQPDESDMCSEADTLASREVSEVDSPMPQDEASQGSTSLSSSDSDQHASQSSPPDFSELKEKPDEPQPPLVSTQPALVSKQPPLVSILKPSTSKDKAKPDQHPNSPGAKTSAEPAADSRPTHRESPKHQRPRRVAFTTLQRKLPSDGAQSTFGEFNVSEFISKQKSIIRSHHPQSGRSSARVGQEERQTRVRTSSRRHTGAGRAESRDKAKQSDTSSSDRSTSAGAHIPETDQTLKQTMNDKETVGTKTDTMQKKETVSKKTELPSNERLATETSKSGNAGPLQLSSNQSSKSEKKQDSEEKTDKVPELPNITSHESGAKLKDEATCSPMTKLKSHHPELSSPSSAPLKRDNTSRVSPGPVTEQSLFGTISCSTVWDSSVMSKTPTSVPPKSTSGSASVKKSSASVRLDFSTAELSTSATTVSTLSESSSSKSGSSGSAESSSEPNHTGETEKE